MGANPIAGAPPSSVTMFGWKLQLRGPGKPFCEVASNIKIWGVANALRRMKNGCRIPW